MNILVANTAAESICNITACDLIGKPFPGSNGHCNHLCVQILQETLERKEGIKDRSVECKRSDQEKQSVVVTSSPLLDVDGKFIGVVMGHTGRDPAQSA